MFKFLLYFFIVSLVITPSAFAGSGLYFGLDGVSHELNTKVEIDQTFSSPPPDNISVSSTATKDFSSIGARIGYKYKRRLNHKLFLSPEFTISQPDDDIIYGTNLKIGADIHNFSFYGTGGVSRVEQFDKNQFNYGIGIEYKISRKIFLNIEWQKFDTITEDTTATENFGTQILTTTTVTQRNISTIKVGLTFYLHE